MLKLLYVFLLLVYFTSKVHGQDEHSCDLCNVYKEALSCCKNVMRTARTGWTDFAKHRDIFKGNIGTCLKQ